MKKLKNSRKKIILVVSVFCICTFVKAGLPNEKSKNNFYVCEKTQKIVKTIHSNSLPAMSIKKNNIIKSLNFECENDTSASYYGAKYYLEGNIVKRPDFSFSNENSYASIEGVTCFRGNNMRDGGSYGKVKIKDEKLNIIWKKDIGAIDSWTGVGWNGQPSIVKWNKNMLSNMNINGEKINKKNLKEVIYATLDGNVYFLDLDDGNDTRQRLNIGAPVKGSLTVDPRGLPLLYVGQGIDTNRGRSVPFGYRIFSLIDFKKLYEIKGQDSFARRNWGAFDSTSLIDAVNDYIFICGENGVFYSGCLNTKYENGKISVTPDIQKYRYDIPGKDKRGIENSIAIYKNYGYFADNDGMLQCLNLNTLSPVWIKNVNDDTDSTVVLERNEDSLDLYTACEVDHQGNNGYCYTRKLDAASGKLLWENKYRCAFNDDVNGGALATPIVGKGDISNLVIFNVARTPSYNEGILVAMDKTTGKEVWNLRLKNYCWSSPLALYNENGKSYIVQCDSVGETMLIEGTTGRILDRIQLGANVEGTPAAYENTIVVGTRGGKIIGFTVD